MGLDRFYYLVLMESIGLTRKKKKRQKKKKKREGERDYSLSPELVVQMHILIDVFL